MPTPTPQITVDVNLVDYSGAELGATSQPAWVRVALCNFGAQLPRVVGAGIIGKVSSWFFDIPFAGAPISFLLWGNDQITPGGTYYSISVLDTQKNVIQTNLYVFTGTQTVDLSGTPPFNPPNPPTIPQLQYLPCTGTVPGTAYTAPGQVVFVTYNGVILPPNLALPILSYTLAGGTAITLNFTTVLEDLIYALVIT